MLHGLAVRASAAPILDNLEAAADYMRVLLADEPAEQVWTLFLDVKARLIATELVSLGSVREAAIYPREIVRRALELGATTLILVHNHPSGDPAPSQADVELTQRLVAAAGTLDMQVYDHIVVGRSGWTSLRSRGLIS